ncbi:hypothetical protein E2C01_075835 [Portunus trituberculatus]|uniref:Uncharacterized protein n=1 Tax=Portunus trituberculatus TaxID=210409 RepID=A0A5B7IKE1_PORTR|nr:hypothetical protein [Portunus trituberculatus]
MKTGQTNCTWDELKVDQVSSSHFTLPITPITSCHSAQPSPIFPSLTPHLTLVWGALRQLCDSPSSLSSPSPSLSQSLSLFLPPVLTHALTHG